MNEPKSDCFLFGMEKKGYNLSHFRLEISINWFLHKNNPKINNNPTLNGILKQFLLVALQRLVIT